MDTATTASEVAGGQEFEALRLRLARAHGLAAQGRLQEAEQVAHALLQDCEDSGNDQFKARALRKLAHIAQLQGDYLTSEQRLLNALQIARRVQDHATACLCYYAFSRHLQLGGRLAEAEAELGEALMLAQRAGQRDLEGMVYLEHAVCKQWLGQLEDQLIYAETALELFRDTGEQELLFFTLTLACDAADNLGKEQLAEVMLAEAEALREVDGYANVMCGTYAEAALRRLAAGDEAGARAALARSEACFDPNCDFDTQILLRLARGRLLHAEGDTAAAAEEYGTALALAQEHQSRCHIALVRLESVPAYLALGQLDQARASLLDAELAFELNGSQLNLGRSLCGWVRYYLARGQHQAARSALVRAEGIAAKHSPAIGLHFSADLRASYAALHKA